MLADTVLGKLEALLQELKAAIAHYSTDNINISLSTKEHLIEGLRKKAEEVGKKIEERKRVPQGWGCITREAWGCDICVVRGKAKSDWKDERIARWEARIEVLDLVVRLEVGGGGGG